MKRSHKILAGLVAAATLTIAAAVHAHPGEMGGPGMTEGGMGHGMGHAMMGAGMTGGGMMGHAMGPGAGRGEGAAQQLMTPDERAALREKMRNAKTPEERQKLAAATHAEMEKRAREKGITLPEQPGPGAGMGPNSGMHRH